MPLRFEITMGRYSTSGGTDHLLQRRCREPARRDGRPCDDPTRDRYPLKQDKCSPETAPTIPKFASSRRNTKLKDVAAAVLLSIGQEPPTTHFDIWT